MSNHFQNTDDYNRADPRQEQEYQQYPKYQKIYQMLLASRQLLSLDNFRQRFPKEVIRSAITYPEFFQHNLVADGRVIKVLKGKNALLKAFYYQLFKLTFQLQVPDKDYVEIVKSVIFDPELVQTDGNHSQTSPISGKKHPQIQYKKLLAQFIQLLINQSPPNFQMTLNQYPIIDQALEITFEFLIGYSRKQAKYTNQQILGKLGQIFDINLTTINKCYKFQESDVFLYQQNQEEFYMAFLNQMQEVDDSQNSGISYEKPGDLEQDQNHNIYENQHDQFNHRPIVTQTTQIQPNKMEEYQGKHSYSISQPQNFSPIQQYKDTNLSNTKNQQVGARRISNTNEGSGSFNRKQQTIMNMLGDISKSRQDSFAPFNKNLINSKTSDFRQTNNELALEKMQSEVQKYDVLTTNRTSNSHENIKKGYNSSNQNQQQAEYLIPFHTKKIQNQMSPVQKETYEPYNNPKAIFQTYANRNSRQIIVSDHAKIQTNKISEISPGNRNSGVNIQISNVPPLNQFRPYNNINSQNQNQNSRNSQNQHNLNVYSTPQYIPDNQTYSSNPNNFQNYSSQHNHISYVPNQLLGQQPLIYKPQKLQPHLQTISQMSQSKQVVNTISGQYNAKTPFGLDVNFNRTGNQKKAKELGNDDTKGTFYRQFTNTKILQLVRQPYRTKVQLTKNRFIGVRSRNYMGPDANAYVKKN